jgi:hypothetical protein
MLMKLSIRKLIVMRLKSCMSKFLTLTIFIQKILFCLTVVFINNAQAANPTSYASSADANKVVINEINVVENYVELYFKETVDVNGWVLFFEGQGNNDGSQIVCSATPPSSACEYSAGSFLVLENISLHNTLEELLLLDNSNLAVHYFRYANNANQGGGKWQWATDDASISTILYNNGAKNNLCTKPDGSLSEGDWQECDETKGTDNNGVTLHHILIEHDNSGSTCATETITIKACTDAACSAVLSSSMDLDFQINGITYSSPSFTGTTTVDIDNITEETVTFSLANQSIASSSDLECDDGTGNSCTMYFSSLGCPEGTACSAIFPGDTTFGVNGGSTFYSFGNPSLCNGGSCSPAPNFDVPIMPAITPNGSFANTAIVEGKYEHTTWDLPWYSAVNFSGTGTAVIYFNQSITIPYGTDINLAGNPENVLIIVNGSLTITGGSTINANIYSSGSVAVGNLFFGTTTINGALSAAGALSVWGEGDFNFSDSYIDNMDSEGFCESSTPVIHHFEINHDAEGLTCIAEPLTIKACSDAACTNTIATPTDVQIFADGVLKTTISVTGETEAEFNHLVEEPITLSSDQTYTCNNGSDTSCDISFANAGFVLDVNSGSDISSCESVNFEIKAVKLSDSGVSCAPAFTGGQALDFSFNYSNPTVGTKLPLLNATSMATAGQIETRTITFDANGEATLPIEYDDAGTLSFTLSENISSGVTSSTISKDFYPSKIVVTAKKEDGVLLNNATSSDDPKQVAGGDFDLNFSGQCSDNTETLNYQPQSSNSVQLAVRHILPSSDTSVLGKLTVEGTLINATESANTVWQSINTTEKELVASYSEVGVVSISLKDTDYLGNEINTLSFIDVGRLYPSYFEVSIDHGSFQNASGLDSTPFTYIGMPFGYAYQPIITITAKNYDGEITQNYTETSFQKLTAANVTQTFPSADTTKDGFDTETKMVVEAETQLPADLSKHSNGVMDYTFSNADTFTYTKDSNSEVSEFTVSYDILISSITDSDSVGINSSTNTDIPSTDLPLSVQPTEGVQRFGRLVLENSFGSETSSLAQSFEVEFLNASGDYQRNSDDDFSVVIRDDASWDFSNSTDDIVISDLALSGDDAIFSGGQLKNIELSSGGNQGAIDIEYTTPTWLRYNWSGNASNLHNEDANATATFGVYRGNDRIISWREVGN